MTTPATQDEALDKGSGATGSSAKKWLALVAIAASVLVVGLDLTVLNLALPSIAVSLHATTGDLQWMRKMSGSHIPRACCRTARRPPPLLRASA
jgi:hypothetical protein